jgi:hypothetical protein
MNLGTPYLQGLSNKRIRASSLIPSFATTALLILTPPLTVAQTPTPTTTPSSFLTATPIITALPTDTLLQTEGIGGDIDRDDRDPRITFSVNVKSDGSAKILVNGKVPNEEYQKYPIQYDFFINNRLFSSQVTSLQLPGPIGIDVGADVAPLPFNYTIKATVLHPNRSFTSMAFGAVDESMIVEATPTPEPTSIGTPSTGGNGTSVLDCTVSYDNTGTENFTDYTNRNVTISQSGSLISAVFSATSSDGASSVDVEIAVTAGGSTGDATRPLSGTVQVRSAGSTDNVTIDGEIAYNGDSISDLTGGDPDAQKLDIMCGDGNSSNARLLADRLR